MTAESVVRGIHPGALVGRETIISHTGSPFTTTDENTPVEAARDRPINMVVHFTISGRPKNSILIKAVDS